MEKYNSELCLLSISLTLRDCIECMDTKTLIHISILMTIIVFLYPEVFLGIDFDRSIDIDLLNPMELSDHLYILI